MSKLDELIADLCPNGVVFLPIEKCVEKIDNKKWTLASEETYQYIDLTSVDRNTHLISDTQMINKDNAPSRAQQIVVEGDILLGTTRPMLKRYCMVNQEYDRQICSTGFCVLRAKSAVILNRWLYHQISSTAFFDHVERFQKGTSYPAISDADVKSYAIPVPPLHVQSEIVAILDNFTELAAELTTELTAELTARRKQYEYYSNSVLSFNENVPYCQLNDVIISLNTGLNPRQFFKLNTEDAQNYYITIREIRNGKIVPSEKTDLMNEDARILCNNRSHLEVGDVLFSGTGTIGETAVIEQTPENWNIKEGVYSIKPNQSKILSRFLRYLLMSSPIRTAYMAKVAGGTVKSIPMGEMKKLQIPVPHIEHQQRIVDILDRFDDYCNDITTCLPAEIAARKKQYEFFRDKLLTFKELA